MSAPATGLDDEARVHVAQAVVGRVGGDEFGKSRRVPTETGRGKGLARRARRGVRAGIVGLQQHLGVAVAGDDRDADVVAFGGTGPEGRIRGLSRHGKRQIGAGRQVLRVRGHRRGEGGEKGGCSEHVGSPLPVTGRHLRHRGKPPHS